MNEIKDIKQNDDNFQFVITPECLLYQIISEYGIDPGPWVAKIWRHIYEDFMEGLEKQGIICKESGEEE